jgi:hypothetical protein
VVSRAEGRGAWVGRLARLVLYLLGAGGGPDFDRRKGVNALCLATDVSD